MLDNFRSISFVWDWANKKVFEKIKTNASDSDGRKFKVTVVNGGVVEDLSGASLSLYWETKDKSHEGLDAFQAADIAKGEFELYFKTGMLSNVGTLNANLVLVHPTGRVVSDRFEINVVKGIDDESVESDNSFTALTEALMTVSQYDGRIASNANAINGLQNNKLDKTTFEQNKLSVNQQLQQSEQELTAKFAEAVVDSKRNLYSASYDTEKESIKDIVYYQAHMKNPIGEVYTNVPVELKITFAQGECKNASCLVVKKSDGTVLEHQWESEVNPNPFLTSNLATYPDGSLKNGSLYIMDSLTAIEEKIYTIEVHQVEQTNSFTDKINLVIDSSNPDNVKDKLSANGILLQFEQMQNYWLRYIYKDNVIISNSSALAHKMWYSDKDNVSCHVESANMTLVSKTLSGSGVVFKDYDFEWKRISNESIRYYTKVRMFADGSFNIDAKIQFKNGMPVGNEIRAVGFRTNLAGVATSDTNGIVTDKLIAQAYNSQMYRDIIDQSITYNVKVVKEINSSSNMSLTWTSSLLKVIPAGSLFTASFAYSATNLNPNVMMNRLTVVATKKSKSELRKNVLRLSKKFYDFMHSNGLDKGTAFPALNHFNRIANGVLNGNLLIVDENDLDGQIAINNYIAALESTYQSFTLEGLKNVYQGIGVSERGVEYIGRDTAPLKYMIKACEVTGKTSSMSKLIEFVHVLADFYVWVEVLSGSNGGIRLHHDDIDNYNAEATALKALSYSLSFESNATRQATFDRILRRFNGNVQYKTMLPYHTQSNLVTAPMGHYSYFTLFEYPMVTFDTMSYINQYVSPSGKIDEIGFNESHRMGFYHTSLYAVYIAYKYDTISSLQLAVNLLENILSQCLPSGSKIFPLDRWIAPSATIDGPIETQVVGALLLDEILF